MAKGLDFGLPFFYRVVLPGAVVGAVLLPLLHLFTPALPPDVQLIEDIGLAAIVGIALSALSAALYEFYEGRRLWPSRLYLNRIAASDARMRRIHKEAVEAYERRADPAEQRRYDDRTSLLRREFMINTDGAPIVVAPTRLGNILAAYRHYPMDRYGMSAPFYWERLWLAIDKDTREEIDKGWAPADCFVHMAGGLVIAGMLYGLVTLVIVLFGIWWHLDALPVALPLGLAAATLLIASYISYGLSLPMHVATGESFKAVFDLHRPKLADMNVGSDADRQRWYALWNTLQHRVTASASTPAAQRQAAAPQPQAAVPPETDDSGEL